MPTTAHATTASIPDFPLFTRISCGHKQELEEAFRAHPPEISEFSPGFLFGYAESFEMQVTRINGNICLFGSIHNAPSFFPPLGGDRVLETVETCLGFLRERYGTGRINAVPKSMADLFAGNPRFRVLDDRENYDYVYRTQDLAGLTGSRYQAKRNFVSQFERRYRYEYRNLDEKLISQCRELQEKWCDMKKCGDNVSMAMENRFVLTLLEHFRLCGLMGGAILVEGKVQAFTIAEPLNGSTVSVHVEKANTKFRGIYQAINNLFCRHTLLGRFEYVNREQDVGDPGLRKAKLSYYPARMVEKFNIEFA